MWLYLLWIKSFLKAIFTQLEQNVLDSCNTKNWAGAIFTYITTKFFTFLYCYSSAMLFGLEIDKSPILQKSMNSHNAAYISDKISPALSRRKIFFYIFPPHADDCISIIAIQLFTFDWKREAYFCLITAKEFREELFLYWVNSIDTKPWCKCWKGNVRWWLNYCTWNCKALRFEAKIRSLY